MKKFLFGLVLGLLLASSVTALAATDYGIRLVINGQDITATMDVPPQIIEGRTMVPAKYVAEALGATVLWEEATRTVKINGPANGLPYVGTGGGEAARSTDATASELGEGWITGAELKKKYELEIITNNDNSKMQFKKDTVLICEFPIMGDGITYIVSETSTMYINEPLFLEYYHRAGF